MPAAGSLGTKATLWSGGGGTLAREDQAASWAHAEQAGVWAQPGSPAGLCRPPRPRLTRWPAQVAGVGGGPQAARLDV